MVKLIAQILALYFLAIAFMSGHDAQMDCASACASHISTEQESADDQHEDTCPPLCACSCCGITLAITPKVLSWEQTPIKSYHINAFYYDSPKGITHQNNIWQPPKIA